MDAKTSSIASAAFAMFIWLPVLNVLDLLCYAAGFFMQIDLVTLVTGDLPISLLYSSLTLWKIKYYFLACVMELVTVMLFYSWLRKAGIDRIKMLLAYFGSFSRLTLFLLVAILAILSFRVPSYQIIVLPESECTRYSIIEAEAQDED